MEYGKLTGAVLVGVVMIVIVMVVVVPILGDATYDSLGRNSPTYYFEPVEDGQITFSDGNWIQNGESTPIQGNVVMISDSLVIQYSSGNTVLYDYAGNHFGKFTTITISGNSYTTTGSLATSGTLGTDPVIITDSSSGATMGRFAHKSAFVDKADEVITWKSFNMADASDNTLAMRVLTTGPLTDVDAYGVAFVSNAYTAVTSTEAEFAEGAYTEPNSKVYRVAADPTMNYTTVYDGTTYTVTGESVTSVFAPIEYTEVTDTGNAIQSIVGIAPLLMIVGVIIMIVGMIVMRS